MNAKNKNFQNSLSVEDTLLIINQYMGDSLFRAVIYYQKLAQQIPYLSFHIDKISLISGIPDCLFPQKQRPFELLSSGHNHSNWISVQLLRALQINNILFCFVMDQVLSTRIDRFACLVVICQTTEIAKKWVQNNLFLTQFIVAEPYRRMVKVYETTYLITRVQNIVVSNRFVLWSVNSQKVKAQGNTRFKDKKYQSALFAYQVALGLLADSQKKRQRSVLYANSSACLSQIRLFQSASRYAQIAISIDKTYAKATFRKFHCLLQLKQYKQVLGSLISLKYLVSQSEFEQANSKYMRYISNNLGIVHWIQFINGGNLSFGQYMSDKLFLNFCHDSQAKQSRYHALQNISKYQLLMLHKPMFYQKVDKDNIAQDIEQMVKNTKDILYYQRSYYDQFSGLAHHCPIRERSFIKHSSFTKESDYSLTIKEIQNTFKTCLMHQRKKQAYFVGIWAQILNFRHNCIANCTHLHLKGALIVFAIRNIKKGEILTLDLIEMQPNKKRVDNSKQKLSKRCNCKGCMWPFDYQTKYPAESVYKVYLQIKSQSQMVYPLKIFLYLLWDLIFTHKFREVELLPEYLDLLQRQPIWEYILNCFKLLCGQKKHDLSDSIKSAIKKIFQKYFKIRHEEAVEMVKLFLCKQV